MPRTETCSTCGGKGIVADYGPLGTDFEGDKPCTDCGGNGYVPVSESDAEASPEFPFTEHKVSLKADEAFLSMLEQRDVDLTNDKPTPGRMANQTWRILEEQRMAASETILECEVEIERWTTKMVDATKAMRMAEAGQAVLSGAA